MKNSILIVGAGPSGLILAHELLRRGIAVRIIEKRPGPSHTTRAMTVHARSMEMFEHIGLAWRLEQVCLTCPGNIYHFPFLEDHEHPRTDYRVLPSRFAFYYKINQNDFEQVLREHLYANYSVAPEYGTELIGLSQTNDTVHAHIRLPDSSDEACDYPWAVGCDGVHSFVRQAAGIAFNGEEVAAMAMMDAELENVTFDDRWMNYFFSKDLFMNCTKLPGKYWRLYMSEPTGTYVYADDKLKAFQEVADTLEIGIKIAKPEWVTSWEIRNNIAEKYRNKRMLICGDASHVHSPSGGQGMNGCMQDAFNLGWKLAAVWNGSNSSILDSYERERKPIGEQISEGAMATHEIVMGFGHEPKDRLKFTQEPGWENKTIHLVSGLSHNYRANVKIPAELSSILGPAAGDRAPDACLVEEPQKRIYDLTRHPLFTLLIVPGNNVEEDIQYGHLVRENLENCFPKQVSCHLISKTMDSRFDFDHWIADEGSEFMARYEIAEEGRLILIRPDLYIGMTCLPSENSLLIEYLSQWF